jgi:hypothetical protein
MIFIKNKNHKNIKNYGIIHQTWYKNNSKINQLIYHNIIIIIILDLHNHSIIITNYRKLMLILIIILIIEIILIILMLIIILILILILIIIIIVMYKYKVKYQPHYFRIFKNILSLKKSIKNNKIKKISSKLKSIGKYSKI